MFNVISHCIQMGQAAGTAAAVAVKSGVSCKKVDIKAVQKRLVAQGVALRKRIFCVFVISDFMVGDGIEVVTCHTPNISRYMLEVRGVSFLERSAFVVA